MSETRLRQHSTLIGGKLTHRQGFTLAEVLITLGIIGVVAAITVPVLVMNINKKQWNTASAVFSQKLEESLKIMNSQSTLSGHASTESFVEELSKHFKTNKICKNDKLLDCFSETVLWGGGDATPEEVDISKIKTAKDFGQKDWNSDIIGVQFANGTSALIAYNDSESGNKVCIQDPHSNQVPVGNCLAILYDTSGEKNPNSSGKDIRNNENVKSLGKNCAFMIGDTCYVTAPFVSGSISKAECESLKGELGITTCYGDNDYWAGAVKACGGVSKMPKLADLAEIANLLYGTTNIGAKVDINSGLTLNTTNAASLGFSLNSNNTFYLWSGEESTNNYSFGRSFYPNRTNYFNSYRNDPEQQSFCLGD